MKRFAAAAAAIMILAAIPVSAVSADKTDAPAHTAAKADTVSAIGSVSKVYCTTAAMQLYDKGLLDIDAPVTEYIPEFEMADERYKDITVRMLMNHTSGLMGMIYDDMMLYDDIDESYHDRFLGYLENSRLKYAPGSFATYSNDGFTLLEIVVERVSGESFTDYVRDNISLPLGLEHTGTAKAMYGSDNTAKVFFNGSPIETDYCMAFGSGGIMSTAEEVCRFGSTFFTGDETLLSQSSKDEMQKNNARDRYENAFGLGWDFVEMNDGYKFSRDVKLLFKGGSLIHQYAGLMVAPDEQISVSVTMNGGNFEDSMLLTETLMFDTLEENGVTVTRDEPAALETSETVPDKYLQMADIYADNRGIYSVSFPEGRYMELTELSADAPQTKRYLYTTDDRFVLMEGEPDTAGFKQNSDQQLLSFVEKDGETYICSDSNYYCKGHGRTINSAYEMQRVGQPEVSDDILQAWQQRDGSKYYICNLKYSDSYYTVAPVLKVKLPAGVNGYEKITGSAIIKTLRFTGKTTAEGFVCIPGEAGRELTDLEVVNENGSEYLCTGEKSMYCISEKDIPGFSSDISEIALEKGSAKWYNIGEMGGRTITLDIPEKASVFVYDKYDKLIYSSYIKNYGSRVTLPEEGKIMFAGEDVTVGIC